MQRRATFTIGALLGAALLMGPVAALVARAYPLQQLISMSDSIAAGPATKVDAKKGSLTLGLETLKGQPAAKQVSFVATGPSGKALLDRVAPGQSFVLFTSTQGKGGLFGFTDGTWFRAARAGAGWQVVSTHSEMARTWTGKSVDLANLVREVLAGKTTPPPPNVRLKPSLGPLVKK